MRLPWQKRERVQLLPNKLHTGKLPWCRDARLVWVDGTGALRWERCGERRSYSGTDLSCLTLRGTPLLSRKDPGCPTCASLLATGWGPADCPELETVRETLNGGFTRLEDAVSALAPLLLDGHHKAAAAARLGRAVPCLTILPLESYEMKPGRLPRTAVRDKAGFGPFTVPVAELPAKWLPKQPGQHPQGRPEWPVGRLADREWSAEYRAAGARYPTVKEYALVTAAEIGCPTDEDLRRWLAEPGRYRRELRSALVLLRGGGDSRLKETALRCAALPDRWCSLKEEAFRTLADMRGDADAERFFIDYFVDLDPYSGHPALTEIANSFWN